MSLTLKLDTSDADLVQRVLKALVAKPDACEEVLRLAERMSTATRRTMPNIPADLVRIAAYIETVGKAG